MREDELDVNGRRYGLAHGNDDDDDDDVAAIMAGLVFFLRIASRAHTHTHTSITLEDEAQR